MAKVSKIVKNKKRQCMILKFQEKRQEIKNKMKDKNISDKEKFELQHLLDKMPKDSSKVRYVNRCFVTGNPRGYYRLFGLCRIQIREKFGFALIPGMKKSSW